MPWALKLLAFRPRSQQLGNSLPKASSHIAFASFLSSDYSCSNCLSLKDYFFNAFFFSPQSETCFANDYWILAFYLGSFKIIKKNSPINVLQILVKLLILNFSHSLKKVQEIIFPKLWPSLLAWFIYTWSQTPEVVTIPGKKEKRKRNALYGIFHWLSPHLFLDTQSKFELPDHHNSLVVELM